MFALLAIGLLVGFVVFLTELWSPVLYLVGAVYVGIMTIFWILVGMPEPVLGGVDKGVQAVLIVLFVTCSSVNTNDSRSTVTTAKTTLDPEWPDRVAEPARSLTRRLLIRESTLERRFQTRAIGSTRNRNGLVCHSSSS